MARLALSVNLTAAEYRRAQPRNLPSVPEAFAVLVSVDALRNPISVERLQGPIVMITAVKRSCLVGATLVGCLGIQEWCIFRCSEKRPREASSWDDSKNLKKDAGISIWIYAYGIPADTPLLGGFPPGKELT
jgi:hypothetical protein